MGTEDENQDGVQASAFVVAQVPGDLLGYMDWDDPAFGYWAKPEISPEFQSRQTYGQKYPSLYNKARFGAFDLPVLFAAFAQEQDEIFRRYVVICVSRLERTQQVLADLVSRANSADVTTRALAVRALGLFSVPAAKNELLKALRSSEPSILRAAAGALAHHRGADVEEALIAKLQSDDEASVETVLAALGGIGGEATERELLRLANNTAFFTRYEFVLLAALRATAGELTRRRLPQLLSAGILSDWTFNLYFSKKFGKPSEDVRRGEPGPRTRHRLLIAVALIALLWALSWMIERALQ
jgi:hypothetical protein